MIEYYEVGPFIEKIEYGNIYFWSTTYYKWLESYNFQNLNEINDKILEIRTTYKKLSEIDILLYGITE